MSCVPSDEHGPRVGAGAGMGDEAKSAFLMWLGRIDGMERADPERSAEVRQHEMRVARLCARLASRLGMHDREVSRAFLAGRYHDIGKLSIPSEILFKRAPLDADERRLMEGHTTLGAELLASGEVEPPGYMLDALRYHHERWDGQGYHGLEGEEIPFHARLVSVADVFDALTSTRAYKAGMAEGDALDLMVSNDARCGRASFDPDLLRAFVAMRLSDSGPSIPDEQRGRLASFADSSWDAASIQVPEGGCQGGRAAGFSA